jgi:hypothetical protein
MSWDLSDGTGGLPADLVWLSFSRASLDEWKTAGGRVNAQDLQRFCLKDCVATPSPRPFGPTPNGGPGPDRGGHTPGGPFSTAVTSEGTAGPSVGIEGGAVLWWNPDGSEIIAGRSPEHVDDGPGYMDFSIPVPVLVPGPHPVARRGDSGSPTFEMTTWINTVNGILSQIVPNPVQAPTGPIIMIDPPSANITDAADPIIKA